MKKIIKRIGDFLEKNALFFLVVVLFGNYFAVEHSMYTGTIHAVHYAHLLDVIFGMFVVIFAAMNVYGQFKKEDGEDD